MKLNNVVFRGQFEDALKNFLKDEVIDIRNFRNGAWEPTVQIQDFIKRLDTAKLEYIIEGKSIRQYKIKRK